MKSGSGTGESRKFCMVGAMIRVYRLLDMEYTPFAKEDDLRFFLSKGIAMTESEDEADVFVANRFPSLALFARIQLRRRYRHPKPILIWTHEPRYCLETRPFIPARWRFPDIDVMDLYTRDVYFSNLTIYGLHASRRIEPLGRANLLGPRRKLAVALAGFVPPNRLREVRIEGRDRDLQRERQSLMLFGHRKGFLDIYGHGWPSGVAKGDSRSGDWRSAKFEVLKEYRFNLCMENTDWDHYVSEKIWDSINAGCLPIYKGGGARIFDTFKPGSFVSPDEFATPQDLFEYISTMTGEEFVRRMNLCIEANNRVWESGSFASDYRRCLDAIVTRVTAIAARG